MKPFKYIKMTVKFNGLEQSVFPYFLGSFIRGNFGMYLKNSVCPFGLHRECAHCLIRKKCFYTEIFESDIGSTYGKVVVPPYVFDITGDQFGSEEKVKDLAFNILLYGPALRNYEYFLLVFTEMGRRGIGKNRVKCREVLIEDPNGKLIYSTRHRQLVNEPPELTYRFGRTPPVERLRVSYRSPLRILKDGRAVRVPSFESLIRSALRRLIYLETVYGAGISLPTTQIVEQSTQIKTIANNVHWVHQYRYSNRRRRKMNLGGVLGRQEFQGNIQPYHLDLLRFASIFHLGKSSTFGHGKIEVS